MLQGLKPTGRRKFPLPYFLKRWLVSKASKLSLLADPGQFIFCLLPPCLRTNQAEPHILICGDKGYIYGMHTYQQETLYQRRVTRLTLMTELPAIFCQQWLASKFTFIKISMLQLLSLESSDASLDSSGATVSNTGLKFNPDGTVAGERNIITTSGYRPFN